ncbi:hypothetical protein BC827DRAFT_1265414 [Russula dissimulans]|nr:hypothetical protein BC827DRAFT_1265414 [Russula dissimulans]
MPSSTTKAIFSLLGWSYIPDFITGTLLRWAGPYFRTPITPLHYRLTFAFVVLSYLIYNFLEASLSTPLNFYELLDISPASDGGQIKAAFRAFALREGYEALMEPNKRWAYDRFGAEILSCKECVTQRDFLGRGLIQSLGFHIVSGLALLFFSAIGKSSSVAFWRYTLFFGHFASELSLLFSPSPSSPEYQGYSVLSVFFPTRLAFQHIRLLHQLFMFFSIAVSRVAPVLFPDASGDASSLFLAQSVAATLEKVKTVDRELHNMIEMEMLSVKPPGSKRADDPDEHALELLTREMEHLVIENRLAAVPAGSDLGRARSTVLKRVRTQVQERSHHLRKRTLSQRSTGLGQLPSPVSPTLKPLGSRRDIEVIDVDAFADEKSRQRRMAVTEQESFSSDAGSRFAVYSRARSNSY